MSVQWEDLKDIGPLFKELVRASSAWRLGEGEPGSYDRAGRLIELYLKLGDIIGVSEAAVHRVLVACHASADQDAKQELVMGDDAAQLRGVAQFFMDWGPLAYGPQYAYEMRADFLAQSEGDDPILGCDIPRANRQQPHSFVTLGFKYNTIVTAHYLAGRLDTSWTLEHAQLVPQLGDGREHWNKAVPLAHRELARSAGKSRRLGLAMSDDETNIELFVLRHDPNLAAQVLVRLKARKGSGSAGG